MEELLAIAIVVGVVIAVAFMLKKGSGTVPPISTYKNLEEWEVKYDAGGHMTGIAIHRDASVTGKEL